MTQLSLTELPIVHPIELALMLQSLTVPTPHAHHPARAHAQHEAADSARWIPHERSGEGMEGSTLFVPELPLVCLA